MHRRTIAALLAATLAVAAAPITEPGYTSADGETFFPQSTGWFTASGPTGVGNVDHENGSFMGWDDTEPTGPVGGATVATAASGLRTLVDPDHYDRGQFTASGTVTGFIDSFVLDLYYVSPIADFCGISVAVDLDVDGIPVLDMDGISQRVDAATDSHGDGSHVKLLVTNINELLERYSSDDFDLVGDETTEHQVDVSVQQYPLCNEVVWRYDTADFPAAITFNRDPEDRELVGYTTFDVTNPPTP